MKNLHGPVTALGVSTASNRFRVLVAVLALSVCGVAHGELNNAVRYKEMHAALRLDGWNGNSKSYYGSLVSRAAQDNENLELKQLKYYCELIPACTIRDVYVVMIWGAGGRYQFSHLLAEQSYYHHYPVYKHLHEGAVKGAYIVGFWDNYFAQREGNDEVKHNPEESWPSWHFVLGNPWAPGLAQLESYINTIPRSSKLIIVGASLGGGTAVALSGMLAAASRPIDYLLVFDPAGIYGKRSEAIAHRVQANVKRFFNIWQEQGCWPVDYAVSGRFHIDNTSYTTAEQVLFTGGSDGGPCKVEGSSSESKTVHSETWRNPRAGDNMQRIARQLLTAVREVTAPPPQIEQSHWVEASKVTVVSQGKSSAKPVTFKLETSMAWWTGVRIHRTNGEPYLIEQEYQGGPYNVFVGASKRSGQKSVVVPIEQLAPQIKIEFWTAKAFGVHTYMKETVIDREEAQGRIVRVTWPAP